MTRLLAQTAIALGYEIMVSETHGMSQRGGSVISHLKIGADQAPLIRQGTADVLLALEPDEAIRSMLYLRRGGNAFVNAEGDLRLPSGELLDKFARQIHTLPASRLAVGLGSAAVTNVVLVGFAAAHPVLPFPYTALKETIESRFSRGRELNLLALQKGYEAGQNGSL